MLADFRGTPVEKRTSGVSPGRRKSFLPQFRDQVRRCIRFSEFPDLHPATVPCPPRLYVTKRKNMVYDKALTLRTSRDMIAVSPRRYGYQAEGFDNKFGRSPRNYPGSPDSPSAVSPNTGRVAMGPWQGAFGSTSSNTGSPIYLDSAGSGHFSLNDELTGHATERSAAPAVAADA